MFFSKVQRYVLDGYFDLTVEAVNGPIRANRLMFSGLTQGDMCAAVGGAGTLHVLVEMFQEFGGDKVVVSVA